jgi:homoserine kinase
MTSRTQSDAGIVAGATSRERVHAAVRVPGSTSNLGAGFDCVGMAIDRKLEVHATLTETGGIVVNRSGTLADLRCSPTDDLLWRGFVAACVAARRPVPEHVVLDADSNLPVARGLGSSAAAVVAGALLANRLLGDPLTRTELLDVAATLEGHPDNVAPALLGGAVLSVPAAGHRYHSVPLHVHPSLRFVFAVPGFEVATAHARSLLPRSVEHHAAVRAAAGAAALVAGLERADPVLLAHALDDVLHVPFRRAIVRGYDAVVSAAATAGAIGTTLSGSGSSLVAVTLPGSEQRVAAAMRHAWSTAGVVADTFVTGADAPGASVDGLSVA